MEQLRCVNLRKSFNGVTALDGVTASFPTTGIVAIIGPNGAGKTTWLNVVTGFLRPDAGQVMLGERELTRVRPHRITCAGIARTFQDLRLIGRMSVVENVMLARPGQQAEQLWRALTRMGVRAHERKNRQRALEFLELVGLADRAEEVAASLSYGQQKLLTLACCAATEAAVLLLDEPVAGVHPGMTEKILRFLGTLSSKGKLVVFIEHDIAAVRRVAEHVLVMDHGKVVADGLPDEVLGRPEILEAYVG